MQKIDVQKNILSDQSLLSEAMSKLDTGIGGILLCVDGSEKLTGVMTDGDVRRALLRGATLDSCIDELMVREFTYAHQFEEHAGIMSRLSDVVRHVPIVNDNHEPIDIVSWSGIWRMPVTEPSLAGNELKYVVDCIDSGWVSSQGGYIERFQDAFQDYLGGGFSLTTSSGTTALHLALVALGIGKGDEVLVPDITFGASANVVLHAGATPVFVDIDPYTKTMDIKKAKEAITSCTKAIMPVHLYGHPCDMDGVVKLAKDHNLKVVEDCAESLGSEFRGNKVGLIGDVGCFSFFANKVITTGEGGMVVTKDKELMSKMALLRDHGMDKTRRYWHLVPGYNYRMTNIQAALGLAQLENIESFLKRRASVADTYNSQLSDVQGVKLPHTDSWVKNIHWLYTVEIDPMLTGLSRDEILEGLAALEIDSRPVFPSLNNQPAFSKGRLAGDNSVSKAFADCGLSLPTSNDLSDHDCIRVCDALKKVLSSS